mmetsp:Transcript_8117/g.23354  ORF Transcript_8117/g.23354 Transcript_8117/m.23354 type:complete len:215 (-) Transcript_8117:135-779(-)
MNVFGSNINIDYRRLLPSASQDDDDELGYGIYEDQESQQQRGPSNATAAEEANNPITRCLASVSEMLPNLSMQERMLGCVTCMVAGYLLSFGSLSRLGRLLYGNPVPICVHVTLGNLLTLCGTCFLTGPTNQAKRMWHASRRTASILYISSMWTTFVFLCLPAFMGRGFLLFLLIIVQYIAVTWYCLSYIPFGRDLLKRCCQRMFSSVSGDDSG